MDWIFQHPGKCMLALLALLLVIGFYDHQKEEGLIAECMKDRKEYECRAMFKSNSQPATIVIHQ